MADRAKFTDWLIAKELAGETPRMTHLSQGLFTEICADPKAFLELLADCGVVQHYWPPRGGVPHYVPIQPEPPHVHKWEPYGAVEDRVIAAPGIRIVLTERCYPCPTRVWGNSIRTRHVDWPEP